MADTIHLDLEEAKHPVSASYKSSNDTIRVTYSDGTIEDYPFNLGVEFPAPCGPGVVYGTGSSGTWVYDENGHTVEFLYTSGGSVN